MSRHSEQSKTFLDAVAWVIDIEGGYVNDPDDPGGETKFGISKRQYPHLDILSLTYADAVDIYWRDYWLGARCQDLPDALAVFHFGSHVNHRPARANKILQQGLGVTVDGIVGPQTLRAAHIADQTATLIRCLSYRASFYHLLASNQKRHAGKIRGWLKRLFLLQQHIITHHLTEV